jgi:hypothetical protein
MRSIAILLAVMCTLGCIPYDTNAQEAPATAKAPEPDSIRCDEMVFCAGVKERAPVGVSDTFPGDIYAVYCFTTIAGAGDTTSITHTWYWGDSTAAVVDLPVKSPYWRTWSSKRMKRVWRGTWRVDVATADGTVIKSRQFTLE